MTTHFTRKYHSTLTLIVPPNTITSTTIIAWSSRGESQVTLGMVDR